MGEGRPVEGQNKTGDYSLREPQGLKQTRVVIEAQVTPKNKQ